jgi:tetratricopeptide (TPR) repeat protein
MANFVIGIGRGRFVGYGDRSHYFNTDIFILGSDFKRPEHSAWAVGMFFGGSLKFAGGLELVAEMDGRDANIGMKYRHQYFTTTLAIAKFEQMPWWNSPPYSPRIALSVEADNHASLAAPKVGKIECIAQDFTTKQLLPNSIVDIKEINKRYKALSGTFSVSLPAANYTITVSRPGYIDYIAKIIVKPGVKSKLIFNLKKTEEALKKEASLQAMQTYIQQGKIYFSEGNLSMAKESFTKALAIDPNNTEAKNYLVNIENRRNELIASYANEAKQKEKAKDITKAIQFWQKVLELDPTNVEAKTAIADLQKKKQPEKKPVTETKPPVAKKATKEEIDALYNKGVSYFTAEKYDEALKVFNQVIALDPAHKGAKDYKKRTEARIKALKGG